jgi:hypothetical protein
MVRGYASHVSWWNVWFLRRCEIRAGPEYVIRKYTFFENGTFLLMRHYYAEESCSIATYTVTARGVIKILGGSLVTPGVPRWPSSGRCEDDAIAVSFGGGSSSVPVLICNSFSRDFVIPAISGKIYWEA